LVLFFSGYPAKKRTKMPLVEHHHVVEQPSAYAADEPLRDRVQMRKVASTGSGAEQDR